MGFLYHLEIFRSSFVIFEDDPFRITTTTTTTYTFQKVLSLARMEVEQRFPRMQLVRKAAEQYQRLIMDCTRPTLAIHQQQVKEKKKRKENKKKSIHILPLKNIKSSR
jgi:hypothetical protein